MPPFYVRLLADEAEFTATLFEIPILRRYSGILRKTKFPTEKRAEVLKTRFHSCMFVFTGASLILSVLLTAPLLLCGAAAAFAIPVLAKLYRKCRIEEITPEWLEGFSVSAYHPMQGLLGDEDFRFLSRQPGFDLSLYRKLRRDRLRIFRDYLARLVKDFNRMHLMTRVLIARSSEDRSDLMNQLIWLRVRFSIAVFKAEISYVLCFFGLRSLAVRGLILHIEEMHAQLSAASALQTI
jgi:hypothetical protein